MEDKQIYLRFEYLDEQAIISFLDEIPLSEIINDIWPSLYKRLVLPVVNKTPNKRLMKQNPSQTYVYNKKNKFNEILNSLNKKTNGNIQKNKTIEISCSYLCAGSYESFIDFNDKNGYLLVTRSAPRWIQYDFRNLRVQINSYIIKSCSSRIDIIRSWRIEISDDGLEWEIVDQREDETELKQTGGMKLFNIQMTKPFRFIRIITDKTDFNGFDQFSINKLEFFGNIIEKNE